MTGDGRLYIEEESQLLIGAVLIATLGGVVNWLRRTRKKNWGTFAAAIATAAFAGVMSHYLTSWLEFNTQLQYAISGAAGYSGGILLDALAPMLVHMLHHRIGGKEEK